MPKNLTDYIRYALYGALIVVLMLLYQAWEKEHATMAPKQPTQISHNDYVPSLGDVAKSPSTTQVVTQVLDNKIIPKRFIHITTDLMQVDIDPVGGNITGVKLLNYAETANSNEPYVLLNNQSQEKYIAQSGLISAIGPDTEKGQAVYTVQQENYTLENGQQQLKVDLSWKNDGISFTKQFIFTRGSYEINLNYLINNRSKSDWEGNLYLQLMRKNTPPEHQKGIANFATYFGAAISSPEKPFQKVSFKEMLNTNLSQTIQGGWAAMVQHYFISAWVPEKNWNSQYFSRVTTDGLYTIGMIGPQIEVPNNTEKTITAKFYAGPAIASLLEKVSPGLPLTIDYGWFWMISVVLFWLLEKIHYIVGNWGWSIVFVTLLIKLIFYPLSAKSYRSMSALKKLQPKINQLKERYGDDKQKFTQSTLELYKKEKVNPMSGCLPILVQIPVFIALYWVLIESVQLRHAPFMLWIQDLSTKDPYYILPLLMGLSMFLQQRLNPPPPDPMQARVMMLMPIIFTVLFLNFPAGLMLYWFVNNLVSFLQQWYIMRSIKK